MPELLVCVTDATHLRLNLRLVLEARDLGLPMVLRLMEIGFLPGEPVRVIARGFPAADPLAVRVGQATFALRRHEAALVQVRVDALEAAA